MATIDQLPDSDGVAIHMPIGLLADGFRHAVAWSCRRFLRGEGRSRPDPPQVGLGGVPIAIWA